MHRTYYFHSALLALLVLSGASAASVHAAGPDRATAPEGEVRFYKLANRDFDPYINNPDASEQQWMQTHYARMKGFSPRFDRELTWYPDAWFYRDAYAIKPDWEVFAEHPEWVLRDASNNLLYIPWGCSGGTCPQYAGDFGNPDFRAWWIAEAAAIVAEGYRGIWIDDVNMTWRVSNGNGSFVNPIDPRTGNPMTLDNWRRYMAQFMEEVRAAFPGLELGHNIVWYAGPRDNDNPWIAREIDAADYINLERGVTDLGLTGTDGRFGLTTFLEFIDFVHGRGADVILMDEAATNTQRQYALAGWFAINNGNDLMSSENPNWTTPDSWWLGYDLNLGDALGPRYEWQTLIRRDFECGVVMLNPPDRAGVSVNLGRSYGTIGGGTFNSTTLFGDQSLILLDVCATYRGDADTDGDGVTDNADNCINATNGNQRDSDGDGFGNRCDGDFNNDCVVNGIDLGILKARFFSNDPDADLNGDGVVNTIDLGRLKTGFFEPPGPSAATNACGS